MPIDYRYKVPINKLATGVDIISQLKILDHEFVKAGLGQFRPFNSTYTVITQAIDDTVKRGEFNDPKTVLRLELVFANLYFEALNQYADGTGLPGRWQPAGWKHLPASVSLIFGARAHITQDLMPALQKAVADSEAFMADFELINRLLIAGNPKILKSYREPNGFLNYLKNHLSFIYQPIAMRIIMHWRKQAWREFTRLPN